MAKKKAAKKAKAPVKPAKGPSKKKTPAKKSGVGSRETGVKSKPGTKTVPAKKTVKKTAKKAVAKPAKKVPAKPIKKVAENPAKKVLSKAVAVRSKPTPPKVKDEGQLLAESVIRGILEKKGQNVRLLDLRGIETAVCDYFIICEGGSNTQVEAIADSVEDTVKKELSQRPYRSEGWENALWILIDYVNVVVHVFERETRYFYNLESLWADAEEIKVDQ